MKSNYWMIQDAKTKVLGLTFDLFRAEEALWKAEDNVAPMASVFSCWRRELEQKAGRSLPSLPDHPTVEAVRWAKARIQRIQKDLDEATEELARVEALPREEVVVEIRPFHVEVDPIDLDQI